VEIVSTDRPSGLPARAGGRGDLLPELPSLRRLDGSPPRPAKAYVSRAANDNDVLFQSERKRFESIRAPRLSDSVRSRC
jgi:hypothetical protein